MAKYGAELTEKIISLIEDEFFTVSQICKATGISRQTFYYWMDTKEEFSREIEQAMTHREAEMMTMVQASLKKKLEGYYTTVEKDLYVPDKHTGEVVFKQKTIMKKECPPDLRTIKMLLERQDRKDSPSRPPRREEKDEERYIEDREREEPVEDITLNPAEEILKTCAEGIAEYPPKNEHIEKDMEVLTSSQKRKAEHKKKRNMTAEKIKKSVRFAQYMTKNRKSLYIALTGRDLRGRTHSTQGVAIGLKYAAPSGHPEKKQAESLIYNSPGYRPGYG